MDTLDTNQNTPAADDGALRSAEPTPARFHWHWSDLLIFIGMSFFSQVVTLFLLSLVSPAFSPVSEAILSLGGLVGSVYLLGWRRKRQSWVAVGMRRVSGRWVGAAIGLGLILPIVDGFIEYGLQVLMGHLGVHPQPVQAPDSSLVSSIGFLLSIWIVAPLAEEVFFRGVLYTLVRERWGVWIGVIVSSLVFAVGHLSVPLAVPAFILGCLSALLYERTRSLWPSLIIHCLNNAGTLLTYLLLVVSLKLPLR